jgi:hypothetical protein
MHATIEDAGSQAPLPTPILYGKDTAIDLFTFRIVNVREHRFGDAFGQSDPSRPTKVSSKPCRASRQKGFKTIAEYRDVSTCDIPNGDPIAIFGGPNDCFEYRRLDAKASQIKQFPRLLVSAHFFDELVDQAADV